MFSFSLDGPYRYLCARYLTPPTPLSVQAYHLSLSTLGYVHTGQSSIVFEYNSVELVRFMNNQSSPRMVLGNLQEDFSALYCAPESPFSPHKIPILNSFPASSMMTTSSVKSASGAREVCWSYPSISFLLASPLFVKTVVSHLLLHPTDYLRVADDDV